MWDEFRAHGATAEGALPSLGDHVEEIGDTIDDAQPQWKLATASVTATTAIGIGLTVLTIGASDVIATRMTAGAAAVVPGVAARFTVGGRAILTSPLGAAARRWRGRILLTQAEQSGRLLRAQLATGDAAEDLEHAESLAARRTRADGWPPAPVSPR